MAISILTAAATNLVDYPTGKTSAAELRAKAILAGWLPAEQWFLKSPDELFIELPGNK